MGSGIRDEGTGALAEALRGMSEIEAVTVGLFGVSEEAVALLDALALGCCTQLILLSEVNIRSVPARRFLESIAGLKGLAHLHIPRQAFFLVFCCCTP